MNSLVKKRRLNRINLDISEIGFGAWGIGGNNQGAMAYGPIERNEAIAVLKDAYQQGVNFFDTSPLYGYGYSETLIGETFHDVRANIIISSKAGFLDYQGTQDFSSVGLEKSFNNSLKRLKTDYIDLFQLHSPPLDVILKSDQAFTYLIQLKKKGKIRALGISVKSPHDALEILKLIDVDFFQINFNIIDQRALDVSLFEQCQARQIGIIVRTPLAFGFLTGEYSEKTKFDATDHRSQWSLDQIKKWASAKDLFLQPQYLSPGESPTQFALKYVLSYDAVTTVIPGMLTLKHVQENVSASHLSRFSSEELQGMREIYCNNQFFI